MNFHFYQPADSLRPFVKQYYYWEDDTDGLIQLPQNLFALGDQYLIFIKRGEATIKPAHHTTFTLPPDTVTGHFTCAYQLQVKGPVKVIIVQLNAYGCYRLLKLDPSTFTNYCRNLLLLNDPLWFHLSETLNNLSDAKDVVAILNTTCSQALAQHTCHLKQVDDMADYVLACEGNVHIKTLTRRYHLSRPTLQRIFTSIVGLPPQLYIRMIHYKAALRTLQQLNLPQSHARLTATDFYNQPIIISDFLQPDHIHTTTAATVTLLPPSSLQQVAVAS